MGSFAKEPLENMFLSFHLSMFIPRSRAQARRKESSSSDSGHDPVIDVNQLADRSDLNKTDIIITESLSGSEVHFDLESSEVGEIIAIDPSELSDSSVSSVQVLSASEQALLEFRKRVEAERSRIEAQPALLRQLEDNVKSEQLKLDVFRQALDAVTRRDNSAITAALVAIQKNYPNDYKFYSIGEAAQQMRKKLHDNLRIT